MMHAYNEAVDASLASERRVSLFSGPQSNPSVKGGGLLLAVCRGKVSEGMDFSDHHARGVVSPVDMRRAARCETVC